MLKGHNILCFGAGSWDYPGFQQHTMKLFAEHNRVLFVNPIGSREVSFSLKHLGRYATKIAGMFSQRVDGAVDSVPVCNPHVIPLVYNGLAQRINRRLLARQLQRFLHEHKVDDYILWVGTPTAFFILDTLDPVVTVYNPVNRWSAFDFVNKEKMQAYEREVARRSDIVVCTSDAIRDDLLPYNDHTHVMSHAVHFDHFNGALQDDDIPQELRDIPHPIIGYFGGLHEWVELDLFVDVAKRFPNAQVVIVGHSTEDLGRLEALPNIHLLGHKSFADIPAYLKQFDVCLIPFTVNDLMVAVDPTKLREYLAQGKPVVSTNLPEVAKLGDLVYVGEDHPEFIDLVGKALEEHDPELVQRRIELARQSDWPAKMEEISNIVKAILAGKDGH